jgi:hypothetical protein
MTQTWVSSFHKASAQLFSLPTIATLNPLPSAQVGVSYSAPLSGFGGLPPYTFNVSASTGGNSWGVVAASLVSLPTPATAGQDTVTIGMVDSAGNTAPSVTYALGVLSAGLSVPNRMGGLMSAGGGGSYSSEWFPTYKNRYRDGYLVAGGIPDPVTGWPSNAHSVVLSGTSLLPPWASGTFKCGYIGTGTPSNFNNGVVANIVLGNGTTTYTTFDLTAAAGNFGYSNSAAAKNCFCYLPAYPGTAVDDWSNPNSVTNEAIASYSQLRHIRTEWSGVALWNSQLMTQANRNTASNTQSFHQTNQWFGSQQATLATLPAAGATSAQLSNWTRGAGTWCFTFNEGTSGYEGRLCTVGSGTNPTITWASNRGLTGNVVSASIGYGTEGFPIECQLALAAASNTSLVICEPTFQDGVNNVAGSYTAGTMALVAQYKANYPSWTAPVWFTPGNENWNGTYNSFRVFTESAILGGFADKFTYAGAWMHALANLGRAQFGAQWGAQFGGVLEWQDQQPQQFYETYNYMQTQGWTPSADISWQAVAPYNNPAVSPTSGAGGTQPTVANIVAAVAAGAASQPATSLICGLTILGMHWGIPTMTYEGGPQWNGSQYTGVTNLQAAIMDPSYTAPIVQYYTNLTDRGIQAFSHTTLGVTNPLTGGSNTAGELGNVYPVTTSNTPNWAALMQIAKNAPVFSRNVISGSGSVLAGGNYGDNTGAANPFFPSGLFVHTNGSPYFNTLQGYVGWFYNCTLAGTYSLAITCSGSGSVGTNVEIGTLGGFTIPLSSKTLVNGSNSPGSVTVPLGPGYILLGNGTPQSTLAIAQIQFN